MANGATWCESRSTLGMDMRSTPTLATSCCSRVRIEATGEFAQMSGVYTLADYILGRPSYQRLTGSAIPLPVQTTRGYDLLSFTRRCAPTVGSTLLRPGGGIEFPAFEPGLGLGVSLGQKLANLRPFEDLLDVVSDANLSFIAAMVDWRGMMNDSVTSKGMANFHANGLPQDWEDETFFCDRMNFVQAE